MGAAPKADHPEKPDSPPTQTYLKNPAKTGADCTREITDVTGEKEKSIDWMT
jgi:hypothetical protein